MMDLTLTNDFHNTEVTVRLQDRSGLLTPSQTARVRRELCGTAGCSCGIIRGPQAEAYYGHEWEQDEAGQERLRIFGGAA
jgi:hypothetical protein